MNKKTKDQVAANKSAELVTSRNPSETLGALTGHDATLWATANALWGSMDTAEYNHVLTPGYVGAPKNDNSVSFANQMKYLASQLKKAERARAA